MTAQLRAEGDPRAQGKGGVFDAYPQSSGQKNFYGRLMSGEKIVAGWIDYADIDASIQIP